MEWMLPFGLAVRPTEVVLVGRDGTVMKAPGIKNYMTHDVPSVDPHSSVHEATRRLRSSPAGLVAVCDHRRLVGTLTEPEIAGTAIGLRREARVIELLSPDVSYCFEDTEVEEAVALMRANRVDRVVVLDRRGRVAGAVSLADIEARAPREPIH